MKRFVLLSALLCAAAVFGFAAEMPGGLSAKKAEKISGDWLRGLDGGKYASCYGATAEYLQNKISSRQWLDNINTQRKPLGALKKRTQINVYYAQELPEAPKGDYAVVQYGSVYEHNKIVIETVVLMKEPDGSWKPAGYFIR